MSKLVPQSPLSGIAELGRSTALPADAGVTLGERKFLGHVEIRGNQEEQGFIAALSNTVAIDLPLQPNTTTGTDQRRLLWLGPDRWLLLTAPGDTPVNALGDQLSTALGDGLAAVTDVGSGQTVFDLAGPNARETLAKGVTLDLHPRTFAVGACAQTLLAKSTVLIWPESEQRFAMVVRRSYAGYLWRWLEDAAEEYGLAIV